MPDDFVFNIDKFIQKTGVNIDRFTREFPQDLSREVVEATPVITGTLHASWTASIGAPNFGHIGIPGVDPFGTIALNLMRAKAGDTIYITNTAKYGRFVEFGTSRMSPRSFVRRTVARAASIAAESARRISR